ncbi:hypothetical protein ZWY2020_044030 [Hordeum vulgare]|nr:hypothetical protein ZWY2020_044030 [Hordeum vulgare]
MAGPPSQASLLLQKQLRDLAKNPVDGFSAGLVDDGNVFEWQVTIIGPPETLYDGGYFNAVMTFPRITQTVLLHERWTPVHTVESIVLSIISMLSSPNDESPANIEAAKDWREKRAEFKKKVRTVVRKSQEFL